MFRLLSILLKKRFEFSVPQKKRYLIIENSNFKEISSILKKKFVEKIEFNNSINLYILFKLIVKIKKINQLNYFIECILISNPKVIITAIDTNPNFYRLKKLFTNKIFISIQNGLRNDPMFKKNYKNLICDTIFCNGKSDINFFKSRVKSKIIPIGLIKNNSVNDKIKLIKNCVSYISVYRDIKSDKKKINFLGKFDNISWEEYIKSEKLLIKSLHHYCYKKKIKFYIIGCNYNHLKEKKWYQNVIGNKKVNLIRRSSSTSSYEFLKKTKYIVSMDSTLGLEFLSRGHKIIFFSRTVDKSKKLSKKLYFGAPFIKENKGFFFSNDINENEITKLFNNLKKYSKKKWLNKTKIIRDQLMLYDSNNGIFKETMVNLGCKINDFTYKINKSS